MSERNIPHLRDIFGVPFDGVQYSPRSRRRNDHEVRSPTAVSPPSKHFTDLHISPPEPATDPDSAVSVGSSGEEENYQAHKKKQAKDSNRRSRKESDTYNYNYSGNRTLTQKDVKHLERHLSMKKTIRKKIMRDLRQAFVEDPNEFRMDPERSPLSPDQLREINIHNLSFNGQSDSNFLEILRVESAGSRPTRTARDDDRDSGHGSPTREPPVRYVLACALRPFRIPVSSKGG